LRVSYGLLNLCHRDGHENPEPLEPGVWYRVRVKLNDVGQRVAAGHRLRVALSTSYWPIAWPAPAPVTLAIRTGTSTLDLPVRPPRAEDAALPAFGAPEAAPSDSPRKLRRSVMSRRIEMDLTSNEMVYTLKSGGDAEGASISRLEAIDLDIGHRYMRRYRILESDPLSAQTEIATMAQLGRGEWQIRIECRMRLAATAEAFQFGCDLECYEGERLSFEKSWTLAIPRRLL
jgi:hypothetical protein